MVGSVADLFSGFDIVVAEKIGLIGATAVVLDRKESPLAREIQYAPERRSQFSGD